MLPPMQKKLLNHIEEPIVGYITSEDRIIYVTQSTIVVHGIKGTRIQYKIAGEDVVNFVAGDDQDLAILYRSKCVQIRKLEKLNEVERKFDNIVISGNEEYPILKLERNQLYLVYPTSIQIYFLRDGSKSKYTELFQESSLQRINDILLLNLVGSLSIGVLQLRNRAVMAIIPCTITELHIESISQILCLYPSAGIMHPKTSYLAVLAEQTNVKIYDLMALKQIAEVQVPFYENTRIQMQTDPARQFLLLHYMQKDTGRCLNNIVFKINTEVYYKQNRQKSKNVQFILYRFQINMHQYLSAWSFTADHIYHSYSFYYFKDGDLIQLVKKVPNCFHQTEQTIQCLTDQTFWEDNVQWKDIIDTYLKLQYREMMKYNQMNQQSEQQRLLHEYYQITKDFDQIVNKFSQMISLKSKNIRLTKDQVQIQWEKYMLGIAKQRNYRPETIKLFKIDYQVVKEPHQEKNLIGIELENCMKEMEGREKRVDAKIKEKRMQLEQEKMKRQQQEKERAKKEQKPVLTQQQIKKEQDQYNRFVTQYLAQLQRKQAEQDAKKNKKWDHKTPVDVDPQFKLEMPTLNEEERKLIQQHKSLELSRVSSISSQKQKKVEKEEVDPDWHQFAKILEQVQCQVSPLETHLQKLIDKIDNIQQTSLQKIKQNEDRLKAEMEVDLEAQVRNTCRNLFAKMHVQVKQQMNSAMQRLYQIEQRTIKQTEQSIQHFKNFAKLQVKHRIDPYHNSRRQLQINAQMYVREGKQESEQHKQS